MHRILQETVITIQQSCDRFLSRRRGRKTHPSTPIRYIHRGLGNVYLEAVKVGLRRYP